MLEGLEPRKGDEMPAKDFDTMEDSNRSSNPTIHDVSDPGRRIVLRGALGAALAALYAPFFGGCAGGSERRLDSVASHARANPAHASATDRSGSPFCPSGPTSRVGLWATST